MKDDTVRRLQALEEEYTFTADASGEGNGNQFDESFPDFRALEAVHGDAA